MAVCLKISKELINNVYKHSRATYIIFNIYDKGGRIFIECLNNGVNEINYRKAMESKGGILILNILAANYGCNINLDFKVSCLKAVADLEVNLKDSYI